MVAEVLIPVTVVYSPAARVLHEVALLLSEMSTVAQALQASGLAQRFESIDLGKVLVGVWGRKANLGQALRANDRIEIYRPLSVDPKVARRERFVRQGARSAGLFVKKRAGAKAGY
jgi:putative ubiquitin-RnfH superfamily antitoxin RatB of RatAB toxin-antitoxin module